MMKCLVVGGTGFLGGAIVDALVMNGDDVTILSRGKKTRAVPASVRTVQADRFGDLTQLESENFDWVFDTCAFEPDAVKRLLAVVGDHCQRYVLVSSISVYGTFTKRGLQENEPVPDATIEDLDVAANLTDEQRGSAVSYGQSYGPLKRACEIAAENMIGEKATILRVGLLVGAGDYSDRLTWWVRRLDEATGSRKRVPAPAPQERSVQMIDVRDVANFAMHSAEAGLSGIWNVTGKPRSLGEVLAAIIDKTDSSAEIIWVSEQSILDAKIRPWTDIPLMVPSVPEFKYFLEVSTKRAFQNGLDCRPLSDTLHSLIDWDRLHRDRGLTAGMDAVKEALLLV